VEYVQLALGGVLGATGSYVIAYVIPFALRLSKGRRPSVSAWSVFGAVLLIAGTLFLGGLAGTIFGADLRSALLAGLAYQSTLIGAVPEGWPKLGRH